MSGGAVTTPITHLYLSTGGFTVTHLMHFLFEHKLTTQLFIEFLKEYGYSTKDVLTRDFSSNIGCLLEFLSSQGIYCLVDCYNVLVYSDGTTPRARYHVERNKSIYIIKETENEERRDIIHNYMLAIDKSFNFLNTPF